MNDSYWDRRQGRRLGRRPLIAAGLAGGAAVAAACSGSTNNANKPAPAASTAAPAASQAATAAQAPVVATSSGTAAPLAASPVGRQPKRGGTFRYANMGLDAMDPATAIPAAINGGVYEWLGVWKQTEEKVIPHLATGWEQPDASTITFHLNPAVRFQDKAPVSGRTVTSQDVKFSLNYYNSPAPKFQWKPELAALDLGRTETPNDATLVLHLTRPFVPQLTILLTSTRFYVLPHEIVERDGSLEKEAIGTGAFLVESYVQNGAAHLVRNPKYWKPGLPYLDEQQNLLIKDVQAQLSAFSTGNLDMLQQLSFDQVKELPKTAQVLKTGDWIYTGLCFNVTRKPFDDVRARRALHLAIDRDAINQITFAGNSQPSAAVSPVWGKYALPKQELQQQPGYRQPKDQDLKDAKQLLDAAGVKDLAVTVVSTTASKSIFETQAVAIVDQLAKIGVKVTVDLQDFANYNRTRVAGDFALLGDGQSSGGDPDPVLRQEYYTGGGRNYGKYSNPQVDALIDKQAQEIDVDKRTQIIYDIQRLLLTEMPVASFLHNVLIYALQPYVQGLPEWFGPNGVTPSHALGQTVWLDK